MPKVHLGSVLLGLLLGIAIYHLAKRKIPA